MTPSLVDNERRLAHAAFLHERRTTNRVAEGGPEELERWRADMLVGEELFARRIEYSGLSPQEFGAILSESEPEVAGSDEFERWTRDLETLRELSASGSLEPVPAGLRELSEAAALFWTFLCPFVRLGVARLHAVRARRGLTRDIPPQIEDQLVQALCLRLHPRCTPTLVLDLNVARVRGELVGADAEQRFRHYVDAELRRPDRQRALVDEYPLLYRLLLVVTEHWVEAAADLLERLEHDTHLLEEAFGSIGAFDRLASIKTGLSDPHRRGRSVVHLEFESGTQLVYKPRSLQVDVRFAELLAALNALGLADALHTPRVVDRGTYGWVEYVQHAPCEDEAALRTFYRRLGALIAVVHVLGGVDFHYENLVAAGPHPVLVDLEGLFHPRWFRDKRETAYVRAQQWLEASVIGTGLLPHATAVVQQRLDLSGLGGKAGQIWPRLVPLLKALGTDEMHIELGRAITRGAANRPWLRSRPDQEIEAAAYVDEVVEGFWSASAIIQHSRGEIERLLARFGDVEVRHIARPTVRYGLFLREGWHPDYLRDARARERLLDKLWAEAEGRPELVPLVRAEQADLRVGDIPFFSTRPGSRCVWDSRDARLDDYFDEPALAVAQRRLAGIDVEERRRQTTLIRQAILSLVGERTPAAEDAGESGQEPATRAQLVAAATAIGDYLKERAILGADDACWIGTMMQRRDHWEWHLAPVGATLYEGIGGLALLYAQLAAATGRADFDDLATRAMRPLRQHGRSDPPVGSISIGAFGGAASLAYTLAALALIRGERALVDEAIESILRLRTHIPSDHELDVIGGVAGCAVVALALHRHSGDERLLAMAALCGERLRETAARQPRGVGWVGVVSERPLAGFAHGAAGFAWALHEMESALGDAAFGALAQAALDHERSLFVAASGSWHDNRAVPLGFTAPAWCHGAAGIGLGRLLCLRRRDDALMREEMVRAIAETVGSGFDGNHSLCHGGLGNVEIALLAAQEAGEPDWAVQALRAAGRICTAVSQGRWRCGLPGRVESPAFMSGLSGIGYSLLRIAADGRIPAPLWLDLPESVASADAT